MHDRTELIKVSRKEAKDVDKRIKKLKVKIIYDCTLTSFENIFSDLRKNSSNCFVTFLIEIMLSSCISIWKIALREKNWAFVKSAEEIQMKMHFIVMFSALNFSTLSCWKYFSQSESLRCIFYQYKQTEFLIIRVENLIYESLKSIEFKKDDFIVLCAETQLLTMLAMLHDKRYNTVALFS